MQRPVGRSTNKDRPRQPSTRRIAGWSWSCTYRMPRSIVDGFAVIVVERACTVHPRGCSERRPPSAAVRLTLHLARLARNRFAGIRCGSGARLVDQLECSTVAGCRSCSSWCIWALLRRGSAPWATACSWCSLGVRRVLPDPVRAEELYRELGAGNRWRVVGLIAALAASGVGLLFVHDGHSYGWWLTIWLKVLLLVGAAALFWWVSWRGWPRRVFALPAELPAEQARFRRVAAGDDGSGRARVRTRRAGEPPSVLIAFYGGPMTSQVITSRRRRRPHGTHQPSGAAQRC